MRYNYGKWNAIYNVMIFLKISKYVSILINVVKQIETTANVYNFSLCVFGFLYVSVNIPVCYVVFGGVGVGTQNAKTQTLNFALTMCKFGHIIYALSILTIHRKVCEQQSEARLIWLPVKGCTCPILFSLYSIVKPQKLTPLFIW